MATHPLITAAAAGHLPDWAVAGPERRAHMERVAQLMGSWAEALGLHGLEQERWRAVGHLHDALRDEDPSKLRPRLPPGLQELPDAVLHGPAAAERLRVDGVLDGEILRAVAYHTIGDPGLGTLGRSLYAADFLEPGRSFSGDWQAEMRARMPEELDEVALEIVRARVVHRLEHGAPVPDRTLAFWNTLAAERA